MKTNIKIITLSFLVSFAFLVNGQSKNHRKQMDSPWISKDVVRVSNQAASMTPHFVIKSVGASDAVVSKEVRKSGRGDKNNKAVGNVVSQGYPKWTISKPVNRLTN